MTFNNLERADAIRIRNALRELEEFEAKQQRDARDILVNQAVTWWNTKGIDIDSSTTRTQALIIVKEIKSLINTETDRERLILLNNKLRKSDTKYSAVKKVNPNS